MSANLTAPLRPLLVNFARYFGGAEVRVLDTAQAFQTQGCRIACLANAPLAEKARAAGLDYVTLSRSKLDPRIPARLAQVIREGEFTLVDAHNVQSFFWAYPLLRVMKPRPAFVATVHSSIRAEQKSRVKRMLNGAVAGITLPAFDQLIAVSDHLAAELAQDGLPAGRISRALNGIVPTPIDWSQRAAVRAEFGLDDSALVIGAVGRLEPAKGIDVLLKALQRLQTSWPGLRCLLAGSGSQYSHLTGLARRLGIEQQVIFAGFRGDVSRLLAALDMYVLPSRTEGIPFSLLEAASAGLPCVAARVGGVPEVITDGESGLLVPPEDPEALAQAIDCLLRDRPLAQRLGQAAAESVRARFSMQRMVEGTRSAYCAALAAREANQR